MKRGQHLSNMSWKSYSWKEIGFTGSARPPHALRLRLLRLAERVANAVTFLTHICASNTSKRLGNGRGVPLSGTYVLESGTDPSNRRTCECSEVGQVAYGASANDLRSRATRLRNIEISVAGKGLKRRS